MEHYSDDSHINVGTGVDLSIRELAEKVRDVVYPEAELRFDTTKPDGTPRKVLDVTRLRDLGWSPSIDLDDRHPHDVPVVPRPAGCPRRPPRRRPTCRGGANSEFGHFVTTSA